MDKIITSNDLVYLFRIFLAICAGAVIGYEREHRYKVAGLRTHILISLASALMMIISKYAFFDVLNIAGYSGLGLDVSRVAAGIIAGMGIFSGGIVFIGKRGNVSGLTTAAGIWAMIGIGMVIGAGMYAVGIGSVIFVELVQLILHRDLAIYKHEVVASVTVKLPDADSSYESFANKMSDYGTKLYSMRWEKNSEGTFTLRCDAVFNRKYNRGEVLKILSKIDGVTGFELQ